MKSPLIAEQNNVFPQNLILLQPITGEMKEVSKCIGVLRPVNQCGFIGAK